MKWRSKDNLNSKPRWFTWVPIVAGALAVLAIVSSQRITAGVPQDRPQGDLSTLAGSGSIVAGQGTAEAETQIFIDNLSMEDAEAFNLVTRARQEAFRAGAPPALVPVPAGAPARPGAETAPTEAALPPGSEATPQAPGDFKVFSQHDITAAEVATSQRSTIMEPTTLKMGNAVFYTGNWFAAKSADSGATFTYLNPYTLFPSVNNGFCCDQVTAYAPAQDMAIWGLQYVHDGNSNTLRIARAIGAAGIAANSWTYWNLTPASFAFPAGTWLDYPSMTVGATHLYVSSNAFATSNNAFVGNVVFRIPLAQLAAGGTINWGYWKSNIGTERMTEGAGTTMYWGGFTSTTQMRIHRWDDASNTIFWDNINLNAFNYLSRDGVATSPDGTNWAARADSRPTGAYVAKGIIGFMWTAKQGVNRPKPYTVHARFSETTRALVSQADIWNGSYAWMYPAVMPNAAGDIAGTLQIGGDASGGFAYPGTQAWITDALTGASNTVGAFLYVSSSNDGPNNNAWGDYFTVRRDKTSPNTWVGASHTLQGGGVGANAVPKFFTFGREVAADTKAAITSPAPGSTLAGASVTFNWNTGANALEYYLYVGSTGVGSANIYAASQALGLSRAVTGIPTNGGTIYVRLWTRFAAGWQSTDYTYTAAPAAVKAAITSPTPGTTLAGSSVTFNWNAGSGALEYYLYVGSTGVGTSNIYSASQALVLSRLVTGIPNSGGTIYVRLWTRFASGWQWNDYTYTAPAGVTDIRILPTSLAFVPDTNKTIYVEIDWMDGIGHSHKPSQAVIDSIVATFAREGYKIVIDVSNAIPHQDVLPIINGPSASPAVQALKTTHFNHSADARYFYSLWVHQYSYNGSTSTSSGIGDLPGNTHLVSLGAFSGNTGSFSNQVGTFIHEFGHNLNQKHGGADHDNYKPNYLSVMNYFYQLNGLGTTLQARNWVNTSTGFNNFGYSHGQNPSLNEASLNENLGLGFAKAIDWNCSSTFTTGLAKDLQADNPCTASGATTVLTDYDNWAQINSFVTAGATPPASTDASSVMCVTAEENAPIAATIAAMRAQGLLPSEEELIAETSGGIPVPQAAAAKSFTVYNDGGATLNVTGITPDAAAPWISWEPKTFSVAPGGSQIVYVYADFGLAPAGVTTRRLLVASNDPDENPYPGGVNVTVTGATLPSKAVITSPAQGSTLAGSSVTFNWSAGTAALEYWLYVGSTGVGSSNIYNATQALGLSRLVTGIPTNGGTIYARLWTRFAGGWQWNDYTYTAAAPAIVKAAITTPAPGSTLSGTSTTFGWNTGSSALEYYLYVGSTGVGSANIYSATQALGLSRLVTGIPTNGGTIYVRLWTRFAGGWQWNDYTFTAQLVAVAVRATLSSPTVNSILGTSATFVWNPGSGSTQYWLSVGSSPGAGDIWYQNQGTGLSRLVTGIPADGRKVYLRLWSLVSGVWYGTDYAFTASGTTRGRITSPGEGSTLPGSSATFTWLAGTGATNYWVYVGTVPGGSNLYNQNRGTNLSAAVTGLPTDNSPIYVRLWSFVSGVYVYNDYVYSAYDGGSSRGRINNPPNGATLVGSSTTFNWTAGATATQYWIYVGTTKGSANLLNSNRGTSLSAIATGLPTNGSKVYVRLWSLVGGIWFFNEYEYWAAP